MQKREAGRMLVSGKLVETASTQRSEADALGGAAAVVLEGSGIGHDVTRRRLVAELDSCHTLQTRHHLACMQEAVVLSVTQQSGARMGDSCPACTQHAASFDWLLWQQAAIHRRAGHRTTVAALAQLLVAVDGLHPEHDFSSSGLCCICFIIGKYFYFS